VPATAAPIGGGPTSSTSANVSVTIANAAPQVTLSGAPVFNPAGNYTLLLAATDAGTDTIVSTTVNWGDGTTTVVAGFPTALAHHYALADSLYTITVSVTDEDGTFTGLNAVTADAELASQSQAFVAQLYLDLLHRDADAGGLANFTAMLDQGASPDLVVQSLLASPEYKTAVVNELYLRYLGRPVDPAGLQNALPFLNVGVFGGGGEVALAAMLLNSQEFFTRAGGTNEGFLRAVYLTVLDREITPVELSNRLQLLAAGVPRSSLILGIINSVEFRTDVVMDTYETYLHRPVDPAGLANWVTQLSQMPLAQFLTIVLAGPEFRNQFAAI
ncbi:MAG TPA: DUF4214 domain-containing protein, partial [Gemmataceae bacterium]|nr:DUF4214 domain-containing protein [Gemmataceae bacterium]